jgi:hypothetical protein
MFNLSGRNWNQAVINIKPSGAPEFFMPLIRDSEAKKSSHVGLLTNGPVRTNSHNKSRFLVGSQVVAHRQIKLLVSETHD